MNKYYLYLHLNKETNSPFYVGIGTKEDKSTFRGIYSRAHRKSGRSQYWKNYTNKYAYIIQILEESDNYEYIKNRERQLIKSYGKTSLINGLLVNLTDGGEGVVGYKHSEESRLKMSIAKKGRKVPENRLIQMSLSQKGKKLSKEHKEKIGNSLKGHAFSEETKRKISNTLKNKDGNRTTLRKGLV